jgi:hypothetical protein
MSDTEFLVDPYSMATVPIDLLFEDTQLATGTGFIWRSGSDHFLITNWHNVTGRDVFTDKHISRHAGEPNKVRVHFNQQPSSSTRVLATFDLRDANDLPLWLIHPQVGKQIDIVALPVKITEPAFPYPFNDLESAELRLEVGMDVFVLGYPFGAGRTGLPVWKRASLATEPRAVIPQEQLHLLLDTARVLACQDRPLFGEVGLHISTTTWAAVFSERRSKLVSSGFTRAGSALAELKPNLVLCGQRLSSRKL